MPAPVCSRRFFTSSAVKPLSVSFDIRMCRATRVRRLAKRRGPVLRSLRLAGRVFGPGCSSPFRRRGFGVGLSATGFGHGCFSYRSFGTASPLGRGVLDPTPRRIRPHFVAAVVAACVYRSRTAHRASACVPGSGTRCRGDRHWVEDPTTGMQALVFLYREFLPFWRDTNMTSGIPPMSRMRRATARLLALAGQLEHFLLSGSDFRRELLLGV